jgi:thioredoxin
MQALTHADFKTKVFDYESNPNWNFKGARPAIIDFYADWCGPCKRLTPIMEELSKEYDGLVDIYKVNIDTEQELAGAFGIMSVPSILFIPMTGEPQMAQGALPKDILVKAISEVLNVTP